MNLFRLLDRDELVNSGMPLWPASSSWSTVSRSDPTPAPGSSTARRPPRAWPRSTSTPSSGQARGGHRVSVVLPARNEEATVGRLVAELRERWMRRLPLVDELLVVDSDSTDATAAVARAAGADVVATTDVLPAHGNRPGKGEALWKSLAATTGDLVVFLDSDLVGDVAHYVPGLLGPLLTDPQVDYVKGCYTRPLELDGLVSRPAAAGSPS